MKTHSLKTIITTITTAACTTAFAQEKATVKGTVGDNNGKPLYAATIALLQASDSTLTATAIADEQGHYELPGAKPGSYLLSFTTVGFETAFSAPFGLDAGQTYDAGAVQLAPANRQLQGLTVKASRPVMQVKPDKTVFNVASSISSTGNNGIELLQKMPGILVDDKGNISLKGKKGVRIYVDGRMMQLSGEDLAAYLKSINSNDVEALEIITAPGAKYDASGNAGVVNIRLRKNSSLGTNGSISAGFIQGYTPKGNGALNINHRGRKLNVFANAGFNTGLNEMDIHAPRIQRGNTYDQRLTIISDTRNYNAKAGADYFIDSRQTIGIIATGNISHDDWFSSSRTDMYEEQSTVYTKTLVALNNTPRKRTSFNTNLNYRYTDSAGRELNVDVDYGTFRGRANAYLPNYYERFGDPISQVITTNNMPTDIDIYTARADAALPFAKGRLGLGVKAAYVTTRNSTDFYNVIDGYSELARDRSFGFEYTENVNAAYVSYQRGFGERWSLQAGLRAEQTNSRGVLTRRDGVMQGDNDIERSYLDFFPNAVVTYTADKKNVLNLSYTRRIDRPVYQDLNPFELKIDELTYLKGNSFLLPQYTNTVELAHTWNNRLTTSLGYSHVSHFASEITDTLGNTTFAQQRNIATQQIFSVNISAPFEPTRFWKTFVSAWGNYQTFKGGTLTNALNVNAYCYGASMQNNFTIGKGYSAELTGWFSGPGLYGPVFRTKSMGALDLGIQKTVLAGNGSIRLGVTDILRTGAIWRATNDYNGLLLNIRAVSETRTFRVSFNYNFGNHGVKASRQRETGLESERSRIKTK